MPWRFVQMYGRMPLCEFVVAYALSENNRCLRLLGAGPGELHAGGARQLMISAHELEACWELARGASGEAAYRVCADRLADVAQLLHPVVDEVVARHQLLRLAERSGKEKSRAALTCVETGLAARAQHRHIFQHAFDRLSNVFEADSSAWRELPLAAFEESAWLGGFERCYEGGRESGRRVAEGGGETAFVQWGRWARASFHHLDMIRAGLSPDNRARRWCLGRIVDGFDKLRALNAVRAALTSLALDAKDRIRVEALLEAGSDDCHRRALKLYPHAYGQSPRTFRDGIALDAVRLAYESENRWPRSA